MPHVEEPDRFVAELRRLLDEADAQGHVAA
jgi:hypothetical protein